MQNLILTLAAAVIGALVLFSLAAISWRLTHASDSAAQYAAAKTSLQDVVEIMEQDLSNMGSGLTNNTLNGTTAASANYVGGFTTDTWDLTSATRHVEFCSVGDPTDMASTDIDPTDQWKTGVNNDPGDPSPVTSGSGCDVIRYEWSQTGTVSVRDETTSAHDYQTVPVYTLDRTVNGTADGGSLDVLTEVDFEFLDATDTAVTAANAQTVRAIRVTLKAVSPLNGGTSYTSDEDAALAYDMDQTRWSRTIRPPNLARVLAAN